MKKSWLVLVAICSLGFLNGCGSGSSTQPLPVATHFSVTSANGTPTAGVAFNITVTALDASGQLVTSYSGKVNLTTSNGQAVQPASGTLANGTGTFSVTLSTAGSQSITATAGSLSGTSTQITVSAAAATAQFAVAPANNLVTIGSTLSFTVTAVDSTGAAVTTYSGAVHFTTSDPKGTFLSNNQTLTNGVGIFSVTLNTSGTQTITATDTVSSSIKGTSAPLSVSGPATHLTVTPFTATASTRKRTSVTVTALDASNNLATSYSGTVHFTSTDGKAILPGDGAVLSGSWTFDLTFENAGNQTVTATDTVTKSIAGTSSAISVTATSAPAITSGAPPNGTVGSIYGPTFTQDLRCTSFPLRPGCTPCVPNTVVGCGASLPFCARQRVAPVCIQVEDFVGFSLTAAGGVPPYTWAASSLPAGLSLKSQNPETLINGTPSPGAAATYNVGVTVTDSGTPQVTSSATIYPIVISNPPPPVVGLTPLLPGATINQPFSYTFTATAGLPPYQNWTEKGTLPAGIASLTTSGVLAGTPTITGAFPISITVEDSLGQISAVQDFNFQVYQHGFKPTGSMGAARIGHTATLLTDGTVLLAGAPGLNTAETYDPGTGKFTPTKGSMSVDRDGHTATLLNTGKVLITGGTDVYNNNAPLATAELFDPKTGMFTPTGSMSIARTGHNATLLADGKVLITGGNTLVAELFDPGTGMFTPTTGKMSTARTEDTATLLPSGKVLITGGLGGSAALATAATYDPATETFSATAGTMAVTRNYHTATLLTTGPNSGRVLIAGGNSNNAVAELYDPAIGTFSTTGTMLSTRQRHTATALIDGTVLFAGGSEFDANVDILAAAEIFNPTTGTFTGTGGLLTPRIVHTATLLKDGTVLVTGGLNAAGTLATAELYQ
jgi:Putative Ig domain